MNDRATESSNSPELEQDFSNAQEEQAQVLRSATEPINGQTPAVMGETNDTNGLTFIEKFRASKSTKITAAGLTLVAAIGLGRLTADSNKNDSQIEDTAITAENEAEVDETDADEAGEVFAATESNDTSNKMTGEMIIHEESGRILALGDDALTDLLIPDETAEIKETLANLAEEGSIPRELSNAQTLDRTVTFWRGRAIYTTIFDEPSDVRGVRILFDHPLEVYTDTRRYWVGRHASSGELLAFELGEYNPDTGVTMFTNYKDAIPFHDLENEDLGQQSLARVTKYGETEDPELAIVDLYAACLRGDTQTIEPTIYLWDFDNRSPVDSIYDYEGVPGDLRTYDRPQDHDHIFADHLSIKERNESLPEDQVCQ